MDKNKPRPLSPHVTIHRRVQTAVLSIIHRITGFGLSIGSILIVICIFFIAMGEKYFNIIYFFLGTFLGRVILLIWSFAIFYHLINGIRYLIWSIGYGMNPRNVSITGYLVIVFSFISTIFIWIIALDLI